MVELSRWACSDYLSDNPNGARSERHRLTRKHLSGYDSSRGESVTATLIAVESRAQARKSLSVRKGAFNGGPYRRLRPVGQKTAVGAQERIEVLGEQPIEFPPEGCPRGCQALQPNGAD